MVSFEEFFSLQTFAHRDLWQKDSPIWQPLFQLEEYVKKYPCKIEVDLPEGIILQNKEMISIGEGTVIDPTVMIQGPCVIGKNCKIRHGALLRGNVLLGDGCVIGHGSEVKHCIFLDLARAAHFCYVGDSMIGPNVNLAAGVKCSNLRFDHKEIAIWIRGQKVCTSLKKMGSIIGEDVEVGCNSVLNPGTLIGKKSMIYPLLNVGGFIEPYSCVKSHQLYSKSGVS